MRKYYLANSEARGEVDLREYKAEIVAAVHEVVPKAKVVVSRSWYSVSPPPERGEAIRVGRALSNKDILGRYCVYIPKLFNSIAIEDKEELNGQGKQPCHGGHH